MSTNVETVNAFLAAAAKRDDDTASPLLTDDIVYQNMPIPAVTGKDAVKDTLEMLLAMGTDSEWKVLHQVADGDIVLNERVDSFVIDGKKADLPVMGIFVLRDGLIAEWRDYFDLQTIMSQMPQG